MRVISKEKTRIIIDDDYQESEIFLGKGTFASVYKLIQNGKAYAIKKIPKNLIKRQFREKQLMRQIQISKKVHHENIVNFIDFRDDDKDDFIIKMEFCEGTNLRHYLLSEQYGKLSAEKAKYYATRICLDYIHALAEMRSKMVTNRDIKPDNIIIQIDQKTGKIKSKMIDFGEATFNVHEAMSQVGTKGYMAPQIYFLWGNYTQTCDLWSLGQTIYEIFQGVQPDSFQKQYLGSPFLENFNPQSLKDFQYYYQHLILNGINLSKRRTPGPFREIIRGLLNIISEERMTFAEMLQVLIKRFIEIGQCLESNQQIQYQQNRLLLSQIKQKQTQHQYKRIKQNLRKIGEIFELYNKFVQKLPTARRTNHNQTSNQHDEAILKSQYKDVTKLLIILVRELSNSMNLIVEIMEVEFQCLFQEILVGVIKKEDFQSMWKLADKLMVILGQKYYLEDISSEIRNFVVRHFEPEATSIINLIQKILKN